MTISPCTEGVARLVAKTPVAVEEDYVQKLLHRAMKVLDHLPPWQCSTEAGS